CACERPSLLHGLPTCTKVSPFAFARGDAKVRVEVLAEGTVLVRPGRSPLPGPTRFSSGLTRHRSCGTAAPPWHSLPRSFVRRSGGEVETVVARGDRFPVGARRKRVDALF